jgi:hypothetical protein
MRPWIVAALVLAVAAIAPDFLRTLCACFASIVFESVPYLAGSALLAPLAGRHARLISAYAGCGCGGGPAARSIPAAIATAVLFGVPIACARICAAAALSRWFSHDERAHRAPDILGELHALAPAAIVAAAIAPLAHSLGFDRLSPAFEFVAGVALGALASPCALGGVALAASLRVTAPIATLGILCTAGIVDVYALLRRKPHVHASDPWAFGALALACVLVALRGGAALVHPRIVPALALVALYCVVAAWRARDRSSISARVIAGVVLAAVVIGAPAPVYRATETTLEGAFAGERVDFTGVAVHERGRSALVRYAITCCRADAAPIVLAIDRNTAHVQGTWMHASGVFEDDGPTLRLRVARLVPVAPPSDPFVYR